MQQKRVLFIIPRLGEGRGAEKVVCRLVNAFSKNHQVYLMFFQNDGKPFYINPRVHLIKPDDNGQTQIICQPSGLLWHLKNYLNVFSKVLRVKKAKKEYQIDTTVSFLKLGNVLNVLARSNDKVIVSERNDLNHMGWIYRMSSNFAHHFADCAVFQTKRVQGMYCKKVQKKSHIIINPTEVGCVVNTFRSKKIVTVGSLTAQKNHDLLIRAFARFHTTHPEYHLHIYGEGELLDKLLQTAEKCNIRGFVHFEGYKEDVHVAIADAEQFVFSSNHEGLPNALMEAMMMGHACISTACTGADELIEDGGNGLLVPVGDAKALCDAMCRLSDDPGLRERLGHAASCTAEEWKVDRIVRLWEKIL